jgi:hypothetical protein
VDSFDLEESLRADQMLVESEVSPLHQFNAMLPVVPLDSGLKTYEWVIDQFIYKGMMLFAGAAGAGKTTCLLPLSLIAAGLLQCEGVTARTPRNVVYIAEDVDQVKRIIYGLKQRYEIDEELLKKHFQLRQGNQLAVSDLAGFGREIRSWVREILTPNGPGETTPLVVIDTLSATIRIDNENDNSEAAKMLATLRSGFEGVPLWICVHTAKSLKGADVSQMSVRGASAFEGNAQGVFYLINDTRVGSRFLYGGSGAKRRDQGTLTEIEVRSEQKAEVVEDEFGFKQEVQYLIPELLPSDFESRSNRTQEFLDTEDVKAKELRSSEDKRRVVAVIETFNKRACEEPDKQEHYPSKSMIKSRLQGQMGANKVDGLLKRLADEGLVEEVPLPRGVSRKGATTYVSLVSFFHTPL